MLCHPVRVKHVCRAENLSSAIKGAETFCDTCKKKGVPKKTSNVYCTKCEKKYCAKHAEVSVAKAKIIILFSSPFYWARQETARYNTHSNSNVIAHYPTLMH